MKKNNDSLPFERKSRYNSDRDSYLDKNGNYVYTKLVQHPNGKCERVVVDIIPLTEENKDIIILLDEDDHNTDLQERYNEENADFCIRNQRDNRHGDSNDEDSFDADPLEHIADPGGDMFSRLYIRTNCRPNKRWNRQRHLSVKS